MAGQTKLIIITSNEEIIRQISLHKTTNTQIIDLDNVEQSRSNGKTDGVVLNMAFLSQLYQTNSKTDQVSKRSFDSSDPNPSKSVKASKKSTDTICVICGDHAIGFNYNALSCASCKAFFRRNANLNMEKIRCLTGQGQCAIEHKVPRKCQKCRLERCFTAGMRKDFIQSNEEKEKRRKRLEENRNITSQRLSTLESPTSATLPQTTSNLVSSSPKSNEIDRLLMDMENVDNNNHVLETINESNGIEDILLGTLSIEDWLTIQSVQSSFISTFQIPKEQFANVINLSDRVSALFSWLQFSNQLALRFVNFFRQITEFEDLCLDDRTTLIKYNLFPGFPLCKCYNYKSADDCSSNNSNEDMQQHHRFFTLCGATDSFDDKCFELILSLVQSTKQDPTLLSLLLIILFFTPGLSMSENEPLLNDLSAVNRAQSHYTEVLWNYLVNQFGEFEACRRFTQLLTSILRLQLTAKKVRTFFRDQSATLDAVDKIAPLMQSVLHIS